MYREHTDVTLYEESGITYRYVDDPRYANGPIFLLCRILLASPNKTGKVWLETDSREDALNLVNSWNLKYAGRVQYFLG